MKRYDRLIFVCNSDTATAPMAQAILESKYLLEELQILSKGMVVLFPEPVNPKVQAVLEHRGLTMEEHVSSPLLEEDLDERTLILAMDKAVYQKIKNEFAHADTDNVHVLNEFVGIELEVAEPYGGSLEDYDWCFQELETMIKKLVIQLNEEELLC